jgi:glycosyltransferase involved in cell wall biosynthesis
MLLSVIVPAYRQERTILKDLAHLESVLKKADCDYEIIVVVDGEVDGTRKEACRYKSSKVKVLGYKDNHGKGYAVRYGMLRAKGDIIGFIDAGMEIQPTGLRMLLEHLKWYDADILIGSKRHPVSRVNYPPTRRLYSFGYQMLVRILFGLKVKDTQVGLKLFKREVLKKVLPRLLVKKYAFDIEILSIANYLGFKRIFEGPIELDYRFSSSIEPKTIFWMLWDTLAVFYRLKILHYYDSKNREKWIYDQDLGFKAGLE